MKIGHLALYVNNLEEMKAFYMKYFDAQPNAQYHNETTGLRTYFLDFAGGCRLELMHRPDAAERDRKLAQMGYIHLAFSTGSREHVDALTARLKADGYAVISGPRTTGDGYYESCVLDAEGNQIEITV